MSEEPDQGIWKYQNSLPAVAEKYRLTLGEGNTPFLKKENIYFKCEYKNPSGSHKDRAFAYQISRIFEKGIKNAVVSSSGNAAISAATYCKLADIQLTVFVSTKINKNKLERLEALNCRIIRNDKPLSSSISFAKENGAYNLRQSTDENALYGYSTLAFELLKENKCIDAIFLPVSSGAALNGIAHGYSLITKMPALHAVQTEKIHPISSEFDKDYKREKTSLADAIVAKYTPLKNELTVKIKKSGGWGWVISDVEMIEARKWLLSRDFDCSYEGAAALSALWKAEKKGYKYKNPVCILTGKYYD